MQMPADDSEHRVERVSLADDELQRAEEQLRALLEGGQAPSQDEEAQPEQEPASPSEVEG